MKIYFLHYVFYILISFEVMSKFSFLATPNIEGMRLWWYIQIFGIVIFFGVCLFFVIYFRLIYRRKKVLLHHIDDIDHQAQDLSKQLLVQKIQKSSGKVKLVLFIEYLEKFVTTEPHANISELLISQWFSPEEIREIEQAVYVDIWLSKHIEIKITEILDI